MSDERWVRCGTCGCVTSRDRAHVFGGGDFLCPDCVAASPSDPAPPDDLRDAVCKAATAWALASMDRDTYDLDDAECDLREAVNGYVFDRARFRVAAAVPPTDGETR